MSHDENCRLFLAGTVALPSSSSFGTVKAEDSGLQGPEKWVLCITHVCGPHQSVLRRVLLKHASAVELAKPPEESNAQTQTQTPRSPWLLGTGEIEGFFLNLKSASEPIEARVYVPENIAVSVQADFGVTAADSTEFRPPRTDSTRSSCD